MGIWAWPALLGAHLGAFASSNLDLVAGAILGGRGCRYREMLFVSLAMACVQRARGNVGRHTVAVAVLRPGTLAGTAAFLHAPPRQFEASASTVAGAAHECIVIQIMPRHGSVAAALVRVRSAPCSPRAWPSTIAGHCVHGCALAGLIVSGRQRRRVRNETGAAGTIRRVPSHAKNLVCSVTNVPGTVRNLETGAMSSIAAAKLCGRTRGQVHRG